MGSSTFSKIQFSPVTEPNPHQSLTQDKKEPFNIILTIWLYSLILPTTYYLVHFEKIDDKLLMDLQNLSVLHDMIFCGDSQYF